MTAAWGSRSVAIFLNCCLAVSSGERLWCSEIVSFWNQLVLALQIIYLETSLKQKVIRMKQISQESGWVPWCLALVAYSFVLLERMCAGVGSVVLIHPFLLQETLQLWAEAGTGGSHGSEGFQLHNLLRNKLNSSSK